MRFVINNINMETQKENKEKRVCRHWLQIENCRQCLFETLCHLEDVSNAMDNNVHFIH